jgi:hypothetical protein
VIDLVLAVVENILAVDWGASGGWVRWVVVGGKDASLVHRCLIREGVTNVRLVTYIRNICTGT